MPKLISSKFQGPNNRNTHSTILSAVSNKKPTDLTKKNGVNQNVQATDYKPISPAVSRGD